MELFWNLVFLFFYVCLYIGVFRVVFGVLREYKYIVIIMFINWIKKLLI